METEERRKSPGSNKTSKKGGKRVKALTAEEEAQRREMVKEKLREKLELERTALKVVERLLENSVTEDFLVDCAKFITPANYKDTVEERSIAKLCGYPICPNKLGKIPTQQYKISTKTNRVYDITERKCFCSNFCYKASKEFELQISKTPLWLRQHESPPEIKLLKKGDCGSSGEEVILSQRCLKKQDIENPVDAPPGDRHSDVSDGEQEQDFVSTMISQQQRPRVHWGDLPRRTDEDHDKIQRRKKQTCERQEEENEYSQSGNTESKGIIRESVEKNEKTEIRPVAEYSEMHIDCSEQLVQDKKELPQEPDVEETTAKINLCTLSEKGTVNSRLSVDSKTPTEKKHHPSSSLSATDENSHKTAPPNQTGLSITQVGMSKRGAAGLRDLLENYGHKTKPDSVRLNLLEHLRRTLREWCTEETLKFLYGSHHSLGSSYADIKEEQEDDEKEEKELDEDDLEDEVAVGDAVEQKRPSAPAPDYETLRKETKQTELRVREFYKGTWVLPGEEEEPNGNKVTDRDQSRKDPALPLIDSNAQHIIQKRITVEKLSSCLRNIVGSLHLTMSDISSDLNNLVRTFRFTNTNIIHKTPEWTVIAVVLLHLLSEVSPVVREALEMSASVEYLNMMMKELGLQKQDLLNLVPLFKSPTH
ncbi:putative RNA polymerase II subunit B1 CTD phosphatase rpap2 [Pholidichthys leucotaenia]